MARFFAFLFIFIIILGGIGWGALYLGTRYAPSSEYYGDTPSSLPTISAMPKERATFTTNDGVKIVGDFYPAAATTRNGKVLLLLHMVPETRASYEMFAERAAEAGFASLAIDLRGHGESVYQGDAVLDYTKFVDADHQKSIEDVRAAIRFLNGKGYSDGNIFVAGASIGANFALKLLSENHALKKAVLLSPGLDYRGVKAESAVRDLVQGQSVYFIASDEDVYSAESVKTLLKIVPTGVVIEEKIYTNAGHGTIILGTEMGAIPAIVGWLKK